ncbi:Mediator of RNA polymerase II transcription subunit 34 [Platanthera zijinensis]|uniref:Mediator of RNA polymerase II transcription subunit 34 n=1 Tax=Platanthera zijinensis TaxID=2320716 RepID=A0AAP0AZ58_9ASPA
MLNDHRTRDLQQPEEDTPWDTPVSQAATATYKVKTDLMEMLHIANCVRFVRTVNRPNLFYKVAHTLCDRNSIVTQLDAVAEIADSMGSCRGSQEVSQYNCWNSPYLDHDAEIVHEDDILKLEVAGLKSIKGFGAPLDASTFVSSQVRCVSKRTCVRSSARNQAITEGHKGFIVVPRPWIVQQHDVEVEMES